MDSNVYQSNENSWKEVRIRQKVMTGAVGTESTEMYNK